MVRETDHFVFERGAVTGAYAFDDSAVHRRLVEVVADDLRGFLIGIDEVAGDIAVLNLRMNGIGREERKMLFDVIGTLNAHL